MGMYVVIPNFIMALDSKTTKTENAAFSKSVICTSIVLTSTLHPIEEFSGGGLNRTFCQFGA
jgi:hypothetical protein